MYRDPRFLFPFCVALIFGTSCAVGGLAAPPSAAPTLAEPIAAPATLQVTSADFTAGGTLATAQAFAGMGCTGGNISPALAWRGAPAGTQGYAVIMHDPDAPTGVGFFHWSVFDLPAAVTELPAGAATMLPAGAVQGTTDYGAAGYGGPCPPAGPAHRYIITVYAVDVAKLPMVDAHASGALLRFVLQQHTLAYGRLTGTYART